MNAKTNVMVEKILWLIVIIFVYLLKIYNSIDCFGFLDATGFDLAEKKTRLAIFYLRFAIVFVFLEKEIAREINEKTLKRVKSFKVLSFSFISCVSCEVFIFERKTC